MGRGKPVSHLSFGAPFCRLRLQVPRKDGRGHRQQKSRSDSGPAARMRRKTLRRAGQIPAETVRNAQAPPCYLSQAKQRSGRTAGSRLRRSRAGRSIAAFTDQEVETLGQLF